MPSLWLQEFSSLDALLAIGAALLVLGDIYLHGRRQHMAIMQAVWPLTMLYWGVPGLLFYFWFGRSMPRRGATQDGNMQRPMWQATFNGATHCGAGCALGDFVGDWLAFATGFKLLGSELMAKFLLAFVLAYGFGIVFQDRALAPMRGLGLRDGVLQANKADTLSLVAYEIGMFAWMGFAVWLYPGLQPTGWAYWLMMQIAMILGFATTYPVNWWLISRGIKERM